MYIVFLFLSYPPRVISYFSGALDVQNNEKVPLKKIKLDAEDEGIPPTALREITLLKNLVHENVVCLKDVVMDAQRLYLVFELADSDLKKLMENTEGLLSKELIQVSLPIYSVLKA